MFDEEPFRCEAAVVDQAAFSISSSLSYLSAIGKLQFLLFVAIKIRNGLGATKASICNLPSNEIGE